ncbi:MAG: major capsid protein [Arizlama microvirus]|nr:MAG: major capsid protein [Arizlama microvirus]
MGNVFARTGGNRPGRSVFNLSYDKKFDCKMGQLIPVMCEEVVPGDKFSIGNEIVVRFQPMVAPIMHEVNCYVHYFFVPYRILWASWEEFITGGKDGPQVPDTSPAMVRFKPNLTPTKGSFWDFMGWPLVIPNDEHVPIGMPLLAYWKIYTDYYRDENLQSAMISVPYATTGVVASSSIGTTASVFNRNWEKDYFTSSLPWQQRGVAPALPISGLTSAVWADTQFVNAAGGLSPKLKYSGAADSHFYAESGDDIFRTNLKNAFNANSVDLSDATTFNVADLRLAFQIQKWLERNARGGYRYTEFLRSHFGVNPRDDRLQRPEYIGGSKSPVIISEVLQTSSTDATTPQGNLAGHGITADKSFCASYFAQEYGLIMGILSVMPRSAYQQGIDRQWLRRTKYDFFFPEFANLSEQAIETAEIYTTTVKSENETVFGYQGRYDEMRVKKSMVCNNMRDTLDYWHLARQFASAPLLNSSFLTCIPDTRIFADEVSPGLIVNFGNIIKAIRPLPIMSDPGLIDHH